MEKVKLFERIRWRTPEHQKEWDNLKQKLEKIEKECDKEPKAYISASFLKSIMDENTPKIPLSKD